MDVRGPGITATVARAWRALGADAILMQNKYLFFGCMIAELGLVFTSPRASPSSRRGWRRDSFSSTGLKRGDVVAHLLAFTGSSIATTFAVTAGMFGALALYGDDDERSLGGVGQFRIMGPDRLILASGVGIREIRPLQFVISVSGSGVQGLRAWDASGSRPCGCRAGGPIDLRRRRVRSLSTSTSSTCSCSCCASSAAGGMTSPPLVRICGLRPQTGERLACALERSPDPSLAAATAATRRPPTASRGDSSRRVHSKYAARH